MGEIPHELIDDGRRVQAPSRLTPSAPNQRLNAQKSGDTAPKPWEIPSVQKGMGKSAASLFHVGDRVMHRSFGQGTVLDVRPDGKVLIIDFGKIFGTKAISADMAPMRLVK